MIYQLKVTLKNTKPPIWRRLLVEKDITFSQLHEILQIAFDWDDYHLHMFEATSIPEQKSESSAQTTDQFDLWSTIYVRREIAVIGNPEDHDGGLYFDENKERLSEWVLQEKDKITYTYDFGDNWQHVIELEKILPYEENIQYPHCVKVAHLAPQEDSRGDWLGDEWSDDHPNHKLDAKSNVQIQSQINDHFRQYEDKLRASTVSNQPAPNDANELWRELFDLANQFKQLAPWRWMADYELFAVVDPHSGEIGYCSVLGGGGEVYGLATYVGEEGFRSLIQTVENEIQGFPYEQRSLLLSFDNRSELTVDDYRLIKQLGLTFRGKNAWPTFRSMQPGYAPWFLDKWEIRFFIEVLGQAIHVCERMREKPNLLDIEEDRIFARVKKKLDHAYEWVDDSVANFVPEEEEDLYLYIPEDELADIRKSYPVVDATFECDVSFYPEAVQDHPDDRPYFPYLYMCIDTESGMVIDTKLLQNTDVEGAVRHQFIEMILNLKYIPKTVCIDNKKTFYSLYPLAIELGIKLVRSKLPHIQRARNSIYGEFGI